MLEGSHDPRVPEQASRTSVNAARYAETRPEARYEFGVATTRAHLYNLHYFLTEELGEGSRYSSRPVFGLLGGHRRAYQTT